MALKVGELFASVSLDDSKFQSTLGNLTKSIGNFIGITSLFTLGKESIESYTEFESAFTGVMKTVDETATTTYADLKQTIVEMAGDLPATTTEIAGVMEAAGQLGISADFIKSFTRTMIDMGESTNLSAEDAATTLARFANIMGTEADKYSALGSTIVALGNNFATTEAEIAEMAMRMAGAGKQAGMSESDVFAIATAMSSVGLYADAGGSAFSTFISDMVVASSQGADSMQDFANVAGMSAEEFKNLFDDNATSAFSAFLTGLGKMENASAVLSDMGYEEIRMRDMLLRTSSASDTLTEALILSNTAYEENTALTQEAEKRYATLDSQFATTKNNLTDMFRQFGEALLPAVQTALDAANKLIDGIQALFNEVFVQKNFDGAVDMLKGFAGELSNTMQNFLSDVDYGEVSAQIETFINQLGILIGNAASGLIGAAKKIVSKLIEYMLTPEFWIGLGTGLTNILDGIFGGIMGIFEQILGDYTGNEQSGEIDYKLLINADGEIDVGQAIDLSRYAGSGDAMIQYLKDNGYLPEGALERYEFAAQIFPDITYDEALDNTNIPVVQELIQAGMSSELLGVKIPVFTTPDFTLSGETDQLFIQSISESLSQSGITADFETEANVEVSSVQAATLGEEAKAQFGAAGAEAGNLLNSNAATAIANTTGIEDAIATMADTARNTANKALRSAGITGGQMFSSGIALGILSGESAISRAARKVAQAAIDSLNAKLQIASPSKVSFKTGGYFGEGFANGVKASINQAVSASSSMARMAANAAIVRKPVSLSAGASAGSTSAVIGIDYDQMGEAMSRQRMAWYVNGKYMAEAVAANNARAQNGYQRSIAMGYGK